MFNLIHQGTSPIFQAQNGLSRSITWWGSARSVKYFADFNSEASSRILKKFPSADSTSSHVAAGAVVELHPNSVRLWRRRWAQGDFSLVEQPGRGRKPVFSTLRADPHHVIDRDKPFWA